MNNSLNIAIFSIVNKLYFSFGIPIVVSVLGFTLIVYTNERYTSIQTMNTSLKNGFIFDLRNFDKWTATSRLKSLQGNSTYLEAKVWDDKGRPFASFSQLPENRFSIGGKFITIYDSSMSFELIDEFGANWGKVKITHDWTQLVVNSLSLFFAALVSYIIIILKGRRMISSRLGSALLELDVIASGVRRARQSIKNDPEFIEVISGFKLEVDKISHFEEAKRLGSDVYDLLQALVRAKKRAIESAHYRSVANTTQALAHDVRKPFSTVKSAFLAVESVESLEHLHDVLPAAKSQVDKALLSVEGMLTDVMELGKGSRLVCETVSPKAVIKEVLEEVHQLHQKTKVQLEFDLKHQYALHVDRLRVLRIFSNIINNAVQAITSRRGKECTEGKIWIKTTEVADGMIAFTLGNAGSAISKEACEKLFDAFYTSGKKGGTGLGLAIAKKITEAHGGSIRVESDTEKEKVEFHFTLPAARELDRSKLSLPDKLTAYAVIKTATKTQPGELSRQQQTMVEAFKALAADVQRTYNTKIRIALHDDEPIYRDGIVGLTRATVLADLIEFLHFSSPDDILAEDPSRWHYVISDVDLMHADLNGYDVVRHLVADRRFQGACCIHSNNALTRDFEQASRAGAKGFQPKPMTFEHLLKFLLDNPPLPPAAQKAAASAPTVQKSKSSEPQTSPGTPAKPLIAFVDDDEFLRSLYPKQVTDASIKSFASPEEFWAFAEDPLQLAMLTAVVSDNFFGTLSSTTGIAFTQDLRQRFAGIIVLSSDGMFEPGELEHLDLHTSKGEFLGWKQMSEQLAADTPGMLRAHIKAKVPANTKSEAAKAMHAKARHDLQAFLSSLELTAISMERGQASPDLLRKMMIAKFHSAAQFLSTECIEHWRPPGLSLEDRDCVGQLKAWKVEKQRELSTDPFWQI